MGRRGVNSPSETEAAERAFGDYLALGPGRSLEALWRSYAGNDSAPTHRLRTLKGWSSRHRWQARMTAAVTERVERLLDEAAEIDADTFLGTSRELSRLVAAGGLEPEQVVKVRESVRRKQAAAPAVEVSVTIDVAVRELVEAEARKRGLDPDEVLAEAEMILSTMQAER